MISERTEKIKDFLKRLKNTDALQSVDRDVLHSLLIVLAITLLSYELTDLFYKIITFPLTKQTTALKSGGASYTGNHLQRHLLQDYNVIADRNLFLSTLKPAAGSESREGVVESGDRIADFDLKGTVECNPSCGFIVVEERGTRKQKLYRIRDKIGQHQLIKITRNAATLKNDGREITIRIKETVDGPLIPSASGSRRVALPGGAFGKKPSEESTPPLQQLMNQAVVRPFMNKGVREGYIISNIAGGSLYEKVGLQNGDVILDVNDNPMHNANDLMQFLETMQSGSSMVLNIKRQGNPETINFTWE